MESYYFPDSRLRATLVAARKKLSFAVERPHRLGNSYHAIDALRGIAAVAVLLFHYGRFFYGMPAIGISQAAMANFAPYRLAGWAFQFGGHAVLLFWSISGFVFLHVYGTQPRAPTVRTFFVNRFARLYPLHFITLIVVACIQAVSINLFGDYLIYQWNDAYHFMLQLFLASEWGFSVDRSFNGPIWSVSVEVLIYALFYLYIRFLPVSVTSIGGTILLGLLAVGLLGGENEIALCVVYFFAGCLAYGLFALLPRTGIIAAMTAAALIAGSVAIALLSRMGISLPLTLWLPGLFILALMLLGQIETIVGSGPFRWLKPLGDITYSSYLWHTPVQMTLMLLAGAGLIDPGLFFQGWFVLIFLALVIALSWVSFQHIERPAQRALRHRLTGRQAPTRPAVAP